MTEKISNLQSGISGELALINRLEFLHSQGDALFIDPLSLSESFVCYELISVNITFLLNDAEKIKLNELGKGIKNNMGKAMLHFWGERSKKITLRNPKLYSETKANVLLFKEMIMRLQNKFGMLKFQEKTTKLKR